MENHFMILNHFTFSALFYSKNIVVIVVVQVRIQYMRHFFSLQNSTLLLGGSFFSQLGSQNTTRRSLILAWKNMLLLYPIYFISNNSLTSSYKLDIIHFGCLLFLLLIYSQPSCSIVA